MMSPGLDGGPAWHVLGGGDHRQDVDRQPELRDGGRRLERRGRTRHVHLHLVHRARWLDRDPTGVERDALADHAERLAVASAVVAEDDQLRLLGRPLRHGLEPAHPLGDDLLPAEDLDGHRVVLVGDRLRATGQIGGGDDVGRQVLKLAGEVLGLGPDAGGLDRIGDAARIAADQRQVLEALGLAVVVVLLGLEPIELVGGEDRALDQRVRDGLRILGVWTGDRKRGRLQLCGASRGQCADHPRSLGLELVAISEPHHERPAGTARMNQRRLPVAALDVLRAGSSREWLGKVVTVEDQNREQVGVDLGKRLVGGIDSQGAAGYRGD